MTVNHQIVYGLIWAALSTASFSCRKHQQPAGGNFSLEKVTVDGAYAGLSYREVSLKPVLRFSFSAALDPSPSHADSSVSFTGPAGEAVPFTVSFADRDSSLLVQPSAKLQPLSRYTVGISTGLQGRHGGVLSAPLAVKLTTVMDSTDKFPRISDSALLDLVERQSFRYFWDFAHPVSGMARERNTSGDVCATGGTGFGVMSILVGVHRRFISREEGLERILKITRFLLDKCTRYHGAFAHWINGATGATVPFSADDDGADLVETAYLMQGLLCARQFFQGAAPAEDSLRTQVDSLWNGVDWNWFRRDSGQALYWHWSPDKGWAMNVTVSGWNEALITYVLAASAAHPIPRSVYDAGWARGGLMKNGKQFYGVRLPLGPDYGGPLFFSQYSFLGLDPRHLSDAYAGYWTQNTAQARINYAYCLDNPQKYSGYSASCWGLTASDDNLSGYAVHSPTSDDGVIAPTAAIASMPYTPQESMAALRFFYYKLGDRIWGAYGFTDAFNMTDLWFADSYLAIDQGPEIIMIENYRSGLLWKLLMSCPEITRGLKLLGFTF
jgi:hypothetical protein